MKSFRLLIVLVSAAGALTLAAANAASQTPGYGASLLPASDSTTYQSAGESGSLQATLNQFDSALAAHDVEMLQAVGIKHVSAKRWQKFFKDNPRATVTDHCEASGLFISGDTANWTCLETATIIYEEKPRAFVHVIRFTFAKTNGEWMIADRR